MKVPDALTFPVIQTRRLVLREITLEHLDDIISIFSDPEIARFRGGVIDDRDGAARFVRHVSKAFHAGAGVCWGLTLTPQPNVVGTCSLSWSPANRSAHLGYDLAPASRRQGLMGEAVGAVLEYAFEAMAVNRVQATADVENDPSAALLRSLGFQEEGILREFAVIDGRPHDMRCFSLLRWEWGRRTAR